MSKVLVNESSLTGIADAIRGKNGSTTTYKPSEMAAAITAISGGGNPIIEALDITSNGTYTATDGIDGYSPITVNVPQSGGPPESAFVISGNCDYLNYNGRWDWFFNNYGNKITINPSGVSSWMKGSKIEDWNINSNITVSNFFAKMHYLKTISGQITTTGGNLINNLFNECNYLHNIPVNTYILFESNTGSNMTQAFYLCNSLREIPQTIIPYLNGTVCTNMFCGASTLSEIENFPIHPQYNYNSLNNIVKDVGRLSKFTFATDNGTPYIAEWKTHTLDFSIRTGWNYIKSEVLDYNSGITADKEVTDDTTYQALKDDPDWFTTKVEYSRYNHDSAVATINSLPDTSAYLASAGGTNTIKFNGAAGSATDGGAINTLTEEEIAVATAKGWTVTLV